MEVIALELGSGKWADLEDVIATPEEEKKVGEPRKRIRSTVGSRGDQRGSYMAVRHKIQADEQIKRS